MGRPYSQDLRERVVEAAGVTSRRQAAARFGVGIATSIRLDGRACDDRDGGRPAARAGTPIEARSARGVPARPDRRTRRTEGPRSDITLEEMRARLRDKHDLTVGLGTLWRFRDARDLTYKKRQLMLPSRTAPM